MHAAVPRVLRMADFNTPASTLTGVMAPDMTASGMSCISVRTASSRLLLTSSRNGGPRICSATQLLTPLMILAWSQHPDMFIAGFAEQHVGSRVRAGQRHAEPAEQAPRLSIRSA